MPGWCSGKWTSTPCSSVHRKSSPSPTKAAHTNAPGSRNEKRYEDIDEILEAGIDVVSTVNVQHLESLNDMIFELIDVQVSVYTASAPATASAGSVKSRSRAPWRAPPWPAGRRVRQLVPLGAGDVTFTPSIAAAWASDAAMLLPSPTNASVLPRSGPQRSRSVMQSASAWHGCSSSVSALTT